MEAWPRSGAGEALRAPVGPPELLRRESRSLVQRLRLWTPARYAATAPPWGTRGDLVLHLAQALADAAADLEQQPRRALPRLDSELARADQLAVTSDDLVRAGPDDVLARTATAHLLLHRAELLGDEVPGSLAEALGLDDVEAAGRAACAGAVPSSGHGGAVSGDGGAVTGSGAEER